MARAAAKTNPETESIEQLLEGRRPKKVTVARLEQLIRDWPDHAGTKLYCYRLKPEIDFGQINKKGTNIAILNAPFPEDLRQWFLENHGSGKFDLKFTDSNQAYNQIVNTQIEIPISEADPILDVRTLVRGNVENEQLIQKWVNQGKITLNDVGQATAAGPGAQSAGAAAHNDQMPAAMADTMSHVFKKAFDLAVQQNDPSKMFELFKSMQGEKTSMADMIALVKAMQPTAPATDPTMLQFLKMMGDQNTVLMQKLLNNEPAKAANPIGDFKSMVEAVSEIRDMFPAAGSSRGGSSGWLEALKAIAPAIAPALAPLAMRFMAPQSAPPLPPGAPTAREPAAPQPAAPQPAADPVQIQMQQGNRQLGSLIVSCLQRNLSGEDLASTINVQFGDEAYEAIKAMGADQIKENLRQHAPDLWAKIEPHAAALDELLADFLTAYNTEEDSAG